MKPKSLEIFIPGPAGRLEAKYYKNPKFGSPVAIVLHPHPQYGGTMNNRIVQLMYNIFLENGFLVLKASKEDSKYKSGLVDTKSKVEFLYCTVEVRLKYPQGKSFFPAVWMLPSNDRSFPETDIFEVVGHHPETVYFVHHYMENGEKKKKPTTLFLLN